MASDSLDYQFRFDERDEVRELRELSITGTIPGWLQGTLYRNGSNVYQVGTSTLRHLFDGMAVLHKFVIRDGRVKYQSRILDSQTLEKCQKAQCLLVRQFGTDAVPDPCKNIFSRFFSSFGPTEVSNTNVHVVTRGDKLLTFNEAREVNIVHPDSLCKLDSVDLSKVVAVRGCSAHPIVEADGSMYNLGTSFKMRQAYNIIHIPPVTEAHPEPLLQARVVATVPSRWPGQVSYSHSFGSTQNYFVTLEQTTTLDRLKVLWATIRGRAIEPCMEDLADKQCQFHVIRKSDGQELKIKFLTKSFFTFHFVNCYEEAGCLVVDLSAYQKGTILQNLYLKVLQYNLDKLDEDPARYWRFILPLDIKKAEKWRNLVPMADTSATAVKQSADTVFLTPDKMFTENPKMTMELPQINMEQVRGRRHRYVYISSFIATKSQLSKLDVVKREMLTWHQPGMFAGEPLFVPAPGATREDDGVVLSSCWSASGLNHGFLLVLDASSFKELGRAVLPEGAKVPISYHGTFQPAH